MPLVKIDKTAAVAKLATGPLGIAESHDNSAARLFLVHLINQNLVKVLFLEIPKDQGRTFDTCLAKATLARQGGLSDLEVRKELQLIDAYIPWGNDIPFSGLICQAMSSGVRVVFADRFFVRPRLASEPPGMKTRNETVDKVFNEASWMSGNAASAGCVILFGAEHFASDDATLSNMIGDKIDQQLHWVDFSN
jgi:hypothetical protein